MAISVKCVSCGKGYQVADERAGKKVRCKCGEPIFVPASEQDDWEVDEPDEDETPSRLPAKVSRPAPPKPQARRPARRAPAETVDAFERVEQQRRGARNFGLSMAGTGIAIVVLPLFGLQLRRMGDLGPQGALIVGGALFAIGALSYVSASLISVKPARKRRASSGSVADTDADVDEGVIVNPGERAAKIVLWAIIIAMLAVPGFLLGLPLLLILGLLGVAFWWITIPVLLGGIALFIYWRRQRRPAPRSSKAKSKRRNQKNDEDD